jgi:hypothetical protein
MEKSWLREAASTAVNVTVGQRSREYLTDREVERLIEASGIKSKGSLTNKTELRRSQR